MLKALVDMLQVSSKQGEKRWLSNYELPNSSEKYHAVGTKKQQNLSSFLKEPCTIKSRTQLQGVSAPSSTRQLTLNLKQTRLLVKTVRKR